MSDATTTKERLEEVRNERGFGDLSSFWKALEGEGFSASYDAARTYHIDGREPPAAYLARVAKVFGYRLEWLVTGEGPKTRGSEEQQRAALEEFVTADFVAGVEDGFGEGAYRLVRGLPRAAIVHVWRRFREAPHGTQILRLPLDDVGLGRMVGRALRGPFDALGLYWGNLPDTELEDYVLGICSGLGHLTGIVHVPEKEKSDGRP